MDERAIEIVRNYITEHLDKSDPEPEFEVFTVWKAKVLQNWKYLISSTLFDGMYYELTYNGDKKEWYLDAYKKFENRVMNDGMNKQRKVVITTTYNEMGIIIDTKAEEVAQPEKRTETHACDCISREDVEQTVEDNILCYTHSDRPIDQDPDTECHKAIRIALGMLRKDPRKLPSAQPERKRGEWTDDNACPFCGFQPWYERDIHSLSFCPNCGADMRGEK